MNILVGKTFGIGNAVCAIPMIRALRHRFQDARIDVLIGTGPDDVGAREIFKLVQNEGLINCIFYDQVRGSQKVKFDVAIMSTPFDGRWKNGEHFDADRVMDCRPRPDPSTTGFSSWKKHEVEYQMDNAYELGYSGDIPAISLNKTLLVERDGLIVPDIDPTLPHMSAKRTLYVGLGYKRDAAKLWAVKHWGNENYAQLIALLLSKDRDLCVVASGNMQDFVESIMPISRALNTPRFVGYAMANVSASISVVNSCDMYIGNDTGMAHVAAGCGKPTGVIFKMENASTKSRPWCDRFEIIEGTNREVSVAEMADMYGRLRDKTN